MLEQDASARLSLRAKFLRAIAVLLAVLGATVVLTVSWLELVHAREHTEEVEREIRRILHAKGEGLISAHGRALAMLAADNAFSDMQDLLARTVEGDDDIEFGLFVSHDETVWVYASPTTTATSFVPTPLESILDELSIEVSEVDRRHTRVFRAFGERVMEFAAPVVNEGEPLGSLRYGISTARMESAIRAAKERSQSRLREAIVVIAAVISLTLLIGAAWAVWQARRITEPVARLTRVAEQFTGRDDPRVDVRSNDEIEVLATSFNRMVERLRASHAELQARNLELADEVEERTRAELEREDLQERLIQSQKMEAFGQLAGGVAHDFNNILAVIIGNAELISDALEAGEEPAELPDTIDEIAQASARGANLTRQLLTFARRESGVDERVVDARGVIDEFRTLIRRVLEEHIEFSLQLGDEPLLVEVDPGRLEQVVMNLAVNARDAMVGGGKLTISAEALEFDESEVVTTGMLAPGSYVCLRVADTGEGIEPATVQRIFEPFFTTKAAGRGTGLGLSVVHGIVAQAGGQIDVASAPGEGTTFSVILPRAEALTQTSSERSSKPNLRRIVGPRLLVCEDEPSVRRLAERILTKNGFEVIVVESGSEALERLADTPDIGLLITDVIMPTMNGRELAEAAKSLCPGLKVLFMSGYVGDVLHGQGLSDEEPGLLRKPFRAHELVERVEALLRRPSAQGPN